MQTTTPKNIYQPNASTFSQAKHIIQSWWIVAFPTETVYGLWAHALDVKAVASIFDIKGRPQDNPIIVHLGDTNNITTYAHIQNDIQQTIIDKLMPWPITLLLPKKHNIPDIITAGSSLVGIRIPSNKVALDFLRTTNMPIAAPSANISTKPSPTSAQMVYDNFGEKIPMIIDGDICQVGIESTVVKVEDNHIIITRPWFVTKEDIQQLFANQHITVSYAMTPSQETPGNKYKHYAPKAQVHIITSPTQIDTNGHKACLIATQEFIHKHQKDLATHKALKVMVRGTQTNLATCAYSLFWLYHQCDQLDIQKIYIQSLPEQGIGFSIMNRVKKSVSHPGAY